MDSAWIGTISALLGAALAGGISLIRDRRADERQVARDAAQREHDIAERRFDVRRDAYFAFALASRKAIDRVLEYERVRHCLPGDADEEGPVRDMSGVSDLVRVIGPSSLALAAANASLKIDEWAFCYGDSSYDHAEEALSEFERQARAVLRLDPPAAG